MDLSAKVWLANEVRIWGLAATAIIGVISFAAALTHSRWQADLATLKEKIAQDVQRASDEKIAFAVNDAAQANARAAEANLELARLKAPRSLSEEQKAKIIGAIHDFSGTVFDSALVPGDAESAIFLATLEEILQRGGWKQIDWKGGGVVFTRTNKPIAGMASSQNVIIAVPPDLFDKLNPAALRLEGALLERGIAAQVQNAAGIQNDNEVIHLLMGRKT
ncbi:hypothetical protein [Tardiphaga sp. 862_B3_N1_1]|uniref:hypothetical protein n=1 Tax=Tardiphaga sp. 862_B3_N1_1 TaxID=3240763 RepID=UPI003F8C4555